MSGNDDRATRAERLAAKLRENLRRRKAQSRAIESSSIEAPATEGEPQPLPNEGDGR